MGLNINILNEGIKIYMYILNFYIYKFVYIDEIYIFNGII